ncbi:MAG: nucleotidyltransferase domain-containing protein [Cyanobium sp.]
MLVESLAPLRTMELARVASGPMTSFATLRAERHSRWLEELRCRCRELLQQPMAEGDWPDQIWLFGSRARGDWDGWSDTDLLVVAAEQAVAERWADRLIDAGFGGDVIAMDRARWRALPTHASAIWRAVAQEAIPLLRLEAA